MKYIIKLLTERQGRRVKQGHVHLPAGFSPADPLIFFVFVTKRRSSRSREVRRRAPSPFFFIWDAVVASNREAFF